MYFQSGIFLAWICDKIRILVFNLPGEDPTLSSIFLGLSQTRREPWSWRKLDVSRGTLGKNRSKSEINFLSFRVDSRGKSSSVFYLWANCDLGFDVSFQVHHLKHVSINGLHRKASLEWNSCINSPTFDPHETFYRRCKRIKEESFRVIFAKFCQEKRAQNLDF